MNQEEHIQSVIAVIVTYNRLSLLQRCIDSIRQQSKKVDRILVINNSSTDGTEEWLSMQDDIAFITQPNEGGSVGFYRGIKEAFLLEDDFIWLMDDDAFPDVNCLQNLWHHRIDYDVLGGLVVENGVINLMHNGNFKTKSAISDFMNLRNSLEFADFKHEKNECVPVTFISFIGLFLNRKVVEKIKFPVANYFIFNDDVEYSLRIRQAGFSMAIVPSAAYYHKTFVNEKFDFENYVDAEKKSFLLNKNEESKSSIAYKSAHKTEIVDLYDLFAIRNTIRNLKLYFGLDLKLKILLFKSYWISRWMAKKFYNNPMASNLLLKLAYKQGLEDRFDNAKLKLLYQQFNKK